MAQLELGARVLTADGTEVSDPDSIAFVLAQLTSPGLRLDVVPGRTIVKGDVALCTQSWRLRGRRGPVLRARQPRLLRPPPLPGRLADRDRGALGVGIDPPPARPSEAQAAMTVRPGTRSNSPTLDVATSIPRLTAVAAIHMS